MSIELKHLAPYLPYDINVLLIESGKITKILSLSKILFRNRMQIETIFGSYGDMHFKPILHPLSDLTKEIEHNGERFVPVEWFEIGDDGGESLEYDHGNIKLIGDLNWIAEYDVHYDINYLPYGVVQQLHEWHFDLHNWIEQGLAIDINTLNHA